MNVSGQVTVGYGFSDSASFNRSKMNADYASVQEQSGLFAGDEGYHIDVRNHTDFKGGLITSTAQAEAEGKNRFETGTLSYSDIQNHSNYSGSAFGGGVQADINGGWDGRQVRDKDDNIILNEDGSRASRVNQGIGFGYEKDSQSSLTKSGINTTNLHIRDEKAQQSLTGKSVEETLKDIKTGITTENAQANAGAIENNFDKEALSKELAIQQDVTKNFAPVAAQGIAWASEQLGAVQNYEVLSARKSQVEKALSNSTNPEERAKLQGELTQLTDYLNENQTRYNLWKEGGVGRAALHAAAGGLLTGNVSGAAAAGTTSLAAPAIEKLGETTEAKFGKAGKAVVNATAGLAIGAAVGNGNVSSITAAANTDWNNRQLHPSEQQKIKELAKQLASEKGGTDTYWEERLTLVASAMVDDKENKIAKLGINAVLKDNEIYNLAGYKESLGIAYSALKAEADKNETIKWKDGTDMVLYSEKVNMFQATERQYQDSKMFGSLNYNYPDVNNTNSINNVNNISNIGRLNGLDKTASQRYSNELLGVIAEGNRSRQYSSDIVNRDYINYVTSPKGITEPVIWEDLLVGGGLKLSGKVLSTTNKALTATGETLAKSMASNEAIALGAFTESELKVMLEKLTMNSKSYLDKSFKAAANAPMKTTIANGSAAGLASLGGEVYDYTKENNPKSLIKENLYKSANSVIGDTSKGLLFGNMPIGAMVIGNSLVDKAVTGESNLGKNSISGMEGKALDEMIPSVPGKPFIVEGLQKIIDKTLEESQNKEENNERNN
ncbi:hypothetical protein L4F92_07230 [Avibacterium sp. 21-595]|uniref:hypothetical protein n=1 Tax=Avibacterium sp. 21-595 TaxID=2911527 RepID=UPI002026DA25|nr:hypothetical protein [Avibacterium sp. 21-595]URL05864.1 hypothetical protein L4F92_07230 [Avibacterium sp. 21-595]